MEPHRPQTAKDPVSIPLAVLIGVIGVAFGIWLAVQNQSGLGVDFNQFYAASRLAGTGHLYDWNALRKLEKENGPDVPTGRLPVELFGIKIISWLPYSIARGLWFAGSLGAMVLFCLTWPDAGRVPMVVALACSAPSALLLVLGQDTPFWLIFFAAGLLLMESGKPRTAGVVFALCICKFHLALGLPVMLAAQRRWRTLLSGAAAFSLLLAACFLIEGANWPLRYVENSHMARFSPAAERMPNLAGLVSRLPWPPIAEVVLGLAILLLLWVACRDTADLGFAGALAAACGLLLGRHAYAPDLALLLPLSVILLQRESAPPWLRAWAILTISPAPTLLLVSNYPLLGQTLIVAFVICALITPRPNLLLQRGTPIAH
jgi:hypothetical protein